MCIILCDIVCWHIELFCFCYWICHCAVLHCSVIWCMELVLCVFSMLVSLLVIKAKYGQDVCNLGDEVGCTVFYHIRICYFIIFVYFIILQYDWYCNNRTIFTLIPTTLLPTYYQSYHPFTDITIYLYMYMSILLSMPLWVSQGDFFSCFKVPRPRWQRFYIYLIHINHNHNNYTANSK